MRTIAQDRLMVAPREERAIIDQIRNDHELVERLKITPEEFEVLSKCALFGTLTCKQDMLFILRQIRDVGGPGAEHATLFPKPSAPDDEREDDGPDMRRIPSLRLAHTPLPEPLSLEHIVRRRVPEQFGILFWAIVLVAGIVWNFLIAISRWRDHFMTSIGGPAAQAAPSAAWYSNFDRLPVDVLLRWEILFVAAIAFVAYLQSRRGSRRLKVRPEHRRR